LVTTWRTTTTGRGGGLHAILLDDKTTLADFID